MTKKMKKLMALVLALTLCVSQLALPVLATDTTPADPTAQATTIQGTVDLPLEPGGQTTEPVDVDITISKDSNGQITAEASTAAGETSDSGLQVEYESETVSDAQGSKSESEYTAGSEDGNYAVTGGSESQSQVVESDSEVDVDLIENGVVNNNASGGGEITSTTTPTNSGDETAAQNSANFDQTTVTETDREVQVEVSDVTVSTNEPVYVDKDGNVVDVETSDAYNYYYGAMYCIHNIHEAVCPSCGWYIISKDNAFYKVDADGEYILDENGNRVKLGGEGVCHRVVYDNNGTPDDKSDDKVVDGLYCLDASTGIRNDFMYRLVNLEDAVEEGYYDEGDVAHLRAIMTYGYTWDDDKDDNGIAGDENLANLKDKILADKAAAEASGDADLLALINAINLDDLTQGKAARATGMAVWYYGNRFVLNEGEYIKGEIGGDENTQALYNYLITLTEEKSETQVIDEEKFIDNLQMVVKAPVEGEAANADDDNSNDVYNVDMKFSLVVKPDPVNDDLLVSVMDAEGNAVKTVRIAGTNKEGETYENAGTVDENGKTYYIIDGLKLAENSNTTFNIKLEGTQMLKEGVYVFESEKKRLGDSVDYLYDYWTTDENWNGEASWAKGVLNDYKSKGYDIDFGEDLSKEEYRYYLPLLYYGKGTWNNGKYTLDDLVGSQNFIGKSSGTADVSANMSVNINFNVEEATVTTTRTWRQEATYQPQLLNLDIPVLENNRLEDYEEFILQNAEGEAIPDEPVPLAAAPKTGDPSLVMAAMSALSMAGYSVLGLKRKNEE